MPLFTVKLSCNEQYKQFLDDILKLTISLIVAYLVYISSSTSKATLSFIELYSYLLIGLSFYHLIFKHVIEII